MSMKQKQSRTDKLRRPDEPPKRQIHEAVLTKRNTIQHRTHKRQEG